MYNYHVENQWGGEKAPWHDGGLWILGGRDQNACSAIDIVSADKGRTFTGTITYSGEGPIGFSAVQVCGNTYQVENQWGGPGTRWEPGGWWVIGARDHQRCVQLKVQSNDGGLTLTGENTYSGEGPIGFKAHNSLKKHIRTFVQWGGDAAPWHDNGDMVLSSRELQQVESIDLKSEDRGHTLHGTMVYKGEGPIEVKCSWLMGNTYAIQNQWGGPDEHWRHEGRWLIGGREGQRCVQLKVIGNPLMGQMTYDGEGPIGFKSDNQG